MATSGGFIAPVALRAFRHAFKTTSKLIKDRIANVARPLGNELQPVLVRSSRRHAIHPVARIRQAKGRWYTSHSTINAAVRRFINTASQHAPKYNRSTFPTSATATAVSRLTSRAPFASTLRPNLTGGAFPRTAGGYGLGSGRIGGARYFSHTPTAPAQVINNVSAAVRAFWISGQKAQFDGVSSSGEKKYRSVSSLQAETSQKMRGVARTAPGSYIDFQISPLITSLRTISPSFQFGPRLEQGLPTLNDEGFLECLAVDFSRAFKDLTITMNDLQRLSTLGDLPISMQGKSTLRVRFPGCDAEVVERLCAEVGVQRGIISQDPDFEEVAGANVALLFPFAPSKTPTLSSPGGSVRSQNGYEMVEDFSCDDILNDSSIEGYESMEDISDTESIYFSKQTAKQSSSADYEGLEGIYRFLEQCDAARRIR